MKDDIANGNDAIDGIDVNTLSDESTRTPSKSSLEITNNDNSRQEKAKEEGDVALLSATMATTWMNSILPLVQHVAETSRMNAMVAQEQTQSQLKLQSQQEQLLSQQEQQQQQQIATAMSRPSPVPPVTIPVPVPSPPRFIKVRKREMKIITKSTRPRETILSHTDTDVDLNTSDFERLLVELGQGPMEEVIEEVEYEYDEEPIFPMGVDMDMDMDMDMELGEEEIFYEVDHQSDSEDAFLLEALQFGQDEDKGADTPNGKGTNKSDKIASSGIRDGDDDESDDESDDDDLLGDSDLDILDEASIDAPGWLEGDDEYNDGLDG